VIRSSRQVLRQTDVIRSSRQVLRQTAAKHR
jgi:hypothetical protein